MSVNRQIFSLAWPAIATNITTPLLSLADVAIVGHADNGKLIGAVALGGTVFNILYWLFAFLRMGTSGITAQAFGANNIVEQRRIFTRGALVAALGSCIIFLLVPLLGKQTVCLIDGGGGVAEEAWTYFSLAIIGAPGVLLTYVNSGWLLGMQRPRSIMWIALFTNVLNILTSLILVYGFHLGIRGVALGTAMSQIAGASVGFYIVEKLRKSIKAKNQCNPQNANEKLNTSFWDSYAWKSMFRINSDIFLRTLCLASVTLWFTHAGAKMGNVILAANALLLQLFLVFSYFMDGFAFGGEALAGKYFGARNFITLREVVRKLFLWGFITSVVFTALYFVLGDVFLNLLTDDAPTLNVVRDFSFWAVLVPLMGFTAFTWDGVFIGLTCTRYLLYSMCISMAVFFSIYFIGTGIYADVKSANHVLWFAFVIYLGIRGLSSTLMYFRFLRRVNN